MQNLLPIQHWKCIGPFHKPGNSRDCEKLSKSQGNSGKLREILIFVEETWKTQGK